MLTICSMTWKYLKEFTAQKSHLSFMIFLFECLHGQIYSKPAEEGGGGEEKKEESIWIILVFFFFKSLSFMSSMCLRMRAKAVLARTTWETGVNHPAPQKLNITWFMGYYCKEIWEIEIETNPLKVNKNLKRNIFTSCQILRWRWSQEAV